MLIGRLIGFQMPLKFKTNAHHEARLRVYPPLKGESPKRNNIFCRGLILGRAFLKKTTRI